MSAADIPNFIQQEFEIIGPAVLAACRQPRIAWAVSVSIK